MTGKRPIQQVTLSDFLSYGAQGGAIELLPLNVVIGPNAAGKSNFLEAFAILRATAHDLAASLREGGGIGEYLRKERSAEKPFHLSAVVSDRYSTMSDVSEFLRYAIAVAQVNQRPEVISERLGWDEKHSVNWDRQPFYELKNGGAMIRQRSTGESWNGAEVTREIRRTDLSPVQSILSQRRDPDLYPQLTYVADLFGSIAFFRDWTFGNRTKARAPQPTDLPADFLLPDASNLALVLHELQQRSATRQVLIEYLRRFYASAQSISTKLYGGTVQLFVEEGRDELIPATRLSDGTLRYLALLTILCHPSPPPVVCIEEPELGMHPDILPTIAELLKDASQRTQLIVTTHSDALVSALSDVPETIVVCEPSPQGTQLRRLDRESLSEWLDRYSLGEIWRMGEIGGTRW